MRHPKAQSTLRIAILAGATLACIVWFASTMLGLQLAEGETIRAEVEAEAAVTTRTVETAGTRGCIYDCRGVPLVQSTLSYAVELQYANWDRARAGETLRRTLAVLAERGYAYTSTLPIGGEPLAYTSASDDTLAAFLEKREWESDLSAAALFDRLCERYEIPEDFTAADALAVAGLRYDLEVMGFSPLQPVTLAEDVDRATVAELALYELPGVEIVTRETRTIMTNALAHVLGRVGAIFAEDADAYKALGYPADATVGLSGIEKAYETLLCGKDGSVTRTYDDWGRLIAEDVESVAAAGADVYLTIDLRLQKATEAALEHRILEMRESGGAGKEAEGGAAVAIRVGTGEVLALASYPTYSLQTFAADYASLLEAAYAPIYNRATSGTYAPGSVFKMATATAALQEGVVEPDTIIRDEGVYTYYAPDYLYHCWIYNEYGITHGDLNIVGALQNSCNYYFYEAGRLLGIEALDRYARLLGLGEKTGLEIAESAGILAGPEARADGKWYPGDTLLAAIGQSDNAFTPVQLCNYVATLCAGGVRYQTQLVGSVIASDGTVCEDSTSVEAARIDFDEENLAAILEGMLRVTEDGTASKVFADYPVAVIGKTGSAQVQTGAANGVFVLAAPAENPEIAIAVVVEHGGSGNNVAVIARDMLDAYLAVSAQS
ncbi:MAG: penicillin-binding transpeptidase domain-containing protein [Clostridiaceae bacterium]|nr:penicillin-binding transpeptidase domain-containing protein [Clostridiaceae bacterium]